ncbi:PilX N-terminal domain-containing pilus assembly protein [Sphaerotilus sp.]|uniref:pilus assembly PilX family protein n=1 Tax=Sphaerotilus sp. TaxID=2093942 RepID=UPI0034E1F157
MTRRNESGFSLVTVLMMMVVLVSLALAGMNSSLVQERMAGNARDRNIALQAAEAALRDAEADIEANLSVASPFVSACTSGLCLPPSMTSSNPTSQPLWQTVDWSASAAKSRAYGSVTGATALPGVSAPPRYIVELLPVLPPVSGQSANLGNSDDGTAQAFRISVRATGLRTSTVVILQSTYVKR